MVIDGLYRSARIVTFLEEAGHFGAQTCYATSSFLLLVGMASTLIAMASNLAALSYYSLLFAYLLLLASLSASSFLLRFQFLRACLWCLGTT